MGGFVVSVLLLVAVVFLAGFQYRALLATGALETRSQEVLAHIFGVLSGALDAQNSRRGFVLTGDESMLGRFRETEGRTSEHLAALATLVSDSREQAERVAQLRPRVEELLAHLDATVAHRRSLPENDAVQRRATHVGEDLMQRVRVLTSLLETEERRLLVLRSQATRDSARNAGAALLGAASICLLLLLYMGRTSLREDARRRHAERTVRATNRFLGRVLDHLPLMTFVKEARELRFVEFNRAGEELLGIPAGELLGKNDFDFFPREQAESFVAKDREVLASGGVVDIAQESVQGRLGARLLQTRKLAISGSDGQPEYLVGVSEDITERVRREEDVARLNSELSASLAGALAANQELEAFSYSVSHDLRAPLRAMHAFTRILREEYAPALDAEALRLIDVVSKNAETMGLLIDDLLTFSRVGRQSLVREPVAVEAMVKELVDDLALQGQLGAARVEVQALPPVEADPALLRQVFANLIGNAAKFSRRSPAPRVELDGSRRGDECVYLCSDNGVGFDMRYVDRLFTVFERLHPNGEFEGTGVGLALVRRIVERHGGRVWAESRVGEGAVFGFALPATAERLPAPER